MIRHLKVARDAAVKAKTQAQAMLTLKAIIVSAPAELREQLEGVRGRLALVRHLTKMRPGPMVSTTASAKAALKAIAGRWLTDIGVAHRKGPDPRRMKPRLRCDAALAQRSVRAWCREPA